MSLVPHQSTKSKSKKQQHKFYHFEHIKHNDLSDNNNLWIGDSGTSCHFTNDDTGMFNWEPIHDEIGVGNGNIVVATKRGSIRLVVHQRNGNRSNITLHGCKYIKGLSTNLFSITTALSRGWSLSNKNVHIILTKDDGRIVFDTLDPTTHGVLMMVRMVPIPQPISHHHHVKLRHHANNMKELRRPTTRSQTSTLRQHKHNNASNPAHFPVGMNVNANSAITSISVLLMTR